MREMGRKKAGGVGSAGRRDDNAPRPRRGLPDYLRELRCSLPSDWIEIERSAFRPYLKACRCIQYVTACIVAMRQSKRSGKQCATVGNTSGSQRIEYVSGFVHLFFRVQGKSPIGDLVQIIPGLRPEAELIPSSLPCSTTISATCGPLPPAKSRKKLPAGAKVTNNWLLPNEGLGGLGNVRRALSPANSEPSRQVQDAPPHTVQSILCRLFLNDAMNY